VTTLPAGFSPAGTVLPDRTKRMGGLPPFSGVRIIPGLHGASGSPFRAGFQAPAGKWRSGDRNFPERCLPSIQKV